MIHFILVSSVILFFPLSFCSFFEFFRFFFLVIPIIGSSSTADPSSIVASSTVSSFLSHSSFSYHSLLHFCVTVLSHHSLSPLSLFFFSFSFILSLSLTHSLSPTVRSSSINIPFLPFTHLICPIRRLVLLVLLPRLVPSVRTSVPRTPSESLLFRIRLTFLLVSTNKPFSLFLTPFHLS